MKLIVKAGQKLFGQDANLGAHIALSKVRRNNICSNVIGGAAYHGHHEALEYCLKNVPATNYKYYVDIPSLEEKDDLTNKNGPFIPEVQGFTPLQLALVSPKPNYLVVKLLFAYGADQSIREKSTNNNIMHLASTSGDIELIKYVVYNASNHADLYETNIDGDTPLTLCRKSKNK